VAELGQIDEQRARDAGHGLSERGELGRLGIREQRPNSERLPKLRKRRGFTTLAFPPSWAYDAEGPPVRRPEELLY
jgi:hypothetical protein